jgi:phage terminase small subunit
MLTKKQRDFVFHYTDSWHATKAAIAAGYSERSAYSIGSENLKKPEILAAIEAHIAQIMPKGETLSRLAEHARGSMGDFLRVDEEEVTVSQALVYVTEQEMGGIVSETIARLKGEIADDEQPRRAMIITTETVMRSTARLDLLQAKEKLHLVKKYTLDDKGKVSIELYDAQTALRDFAKIHGVFIERSEITGKDGAPIAVVSATDLAAARKKAQEWEQEQDG